MRQAQAAKPRPQLEAVLQRLLVFVVIVGGILHDDGVVTFTDFTPLLRLPLLWDLDSARRWLRLGDEPLHIILRKTQDVSNSTSSNHYSTRGCNTLKLHH
jgi:hypothetical protein